MNPWPVAWFAQDGKRIKVLESRLAENPLGAAPGTVLALKPLTIAAANGAGAYGMRLYKIFVNLTKKYFKVGRVLYEFTLALKP